MWDNKGKYKVRGILVDLHTATALSDASNKPISGTVPYRALRLDAGQEPHTVASDLESVFYSLLHVASDGKALSWRHCKSVHTMSNEKFRCMFETVRWRRALQHCHPEYHSALDRLHTVIFKGSSDAYKQQPVTAKEVQLILQEEREHLRKQK